MTITIEQIVNLQMLKASLIESTSRLQEHSSKLQQLTDNLKESTRKLECRIQELKK